MASRHAKKVNYVVVNGAAANTDISVTATTTGLDTTYGEHVQLVKTTMRVLHVNTSGTIVDRTSELQKVNPKSFQLSTTNTTGDKLVVIFLDAN